MAAGDGTPHIGDPGTWACAFRDSRSIVPGMPGKVLWKIKIPRHFFRILPRFPAMLARP